MLTLLVCGGCSRQEKTSNDSTQEDTQNVISNLNEEEETIEQEIWDRMDQYEKIRWKMKNTKYKAEDFSYHVTEENTVVIDAYTGTDDIVVIPEEIEGKPVAKVSQLNANNTVEGLVVEYGIKEIGKEAFANWTELKVVYLFGGSQEVGDYAFRACSQLRYVYMVDEIIDLGKGVFSGCEKLCGIQLSEGITVLKEDTFAGCKALGVVGLPESLKEIEKGVFSGCSCLRSLRVPDQVEKIESFPEKAYMITSKGTYGEQYAKEHGIDVK